MRDILRKVNRIFSRNKSVAILAVVAFIGIATVSVNQSLAYFTTFARAKGGVTLDLGNQTKIKEGFKDWQKVIQIENTGDTAVYVRCKIIAASQFEITASGNKWSLKDDGYWYYSDIVTKGGITEPIKAYIKVDESVESSFNVVVIQECIPANKPDADWAPAAKYFDEGGKN